MGDMSVFSVRHEPRDDEVILRGKRIKEKEKMKGGDEGKSKILSVVEG